MDATSSGDLSAIFRGELERAAPELHGFLRSLRADRSDGAAVTGLERLLHKLRGAAATVGQTRLADLVCALESALEEAKSRGLPLPERELGRLEGRASLFFVEAGLPAADPASGPTGPAAAAPADSPPPPPAPAPFAERARAACLTASELLRRVGDVTVERGARTVAREELADLLHRLKGAAVLEGSLKTAGLVGRLVETCRAGVEADPLGIELMSRIAPLFREFGVALPEQRSIRVPVSDAPDAGTAPGPGAATPRPAEAPLELSPRLREGLAKLHVLFVDDSLPVRKVAEKFLREMGVPAAFAHDGRDAMALLGRDRFDLVFTDLEMPRMHGYELVAEVRAREDLRDLPVIVVTGHSASKHQRSAETAGATDYMIKPFTRSSLLEKLKAHGRLDLPGA